MQVRLKISQTNFKEYNVEQMYAHELRIGNWVQDTAPYNYLFQVDAGHISKQANGWGYRPIPITPEVLEKLGFEKDNIDDLDGYSSKGRCSIFLQPVLLEDGAIDWYTYVQFNVGMPHQHLVTNPPQYVHELQNLHFCLTGTELDISLQ
jgi:hypothetical protein